MRAGCTTLRLHKACGCTRTLGGGFALGESSTSSDGGTGAGAGADSGTPREALRSARPTRRRTLEGTRAQRSAFDLTEGSFLTGAANAEKTLTLEEFEKLVDKERIHEFVIVPDPLFPLGLARLNSGMIAFSGRTRKLVLVKRCLSW